MDIRIGTGFDAHPLVPGRKLFLGGAEIPFEYGLDGHSDADVLIHALMDALLGAATKGDIGKIFPDCEAAFEGISSVVLLKRIWNILKEEGYSIGNVDVTVICERPKIKDHTEEMRTILAEALETTIDRVSVKGTTTEKMGFTGRGEGIAAEAVCLIIKE